MKKLLCFSVIICLLCVSSYAQNDDIITDVTIPTQFMGIKIGEIPTRSRITDLGFKFDDEYSNPTYVYAESPDHFKMFGMSYWDAVAFLEDHLVIISNFKNVDSAIAVESILEDYFGPSNELPDEYFISNQTYGRFWRDKNGSVLYFGIGIIEEIYSVFCHIYPVVSQIANNFQYVDLGLSVMWATCNVGATKPEDYGDYFAWGETSPKSRYSWDNAKYRISGDSYKDLKLSKYVINKKHGTVDSKTRLELSDDAARANWGGRWRMPTRAEQDELREKCTWTWTTQGGHKGYKVTSKSNGNSIFLPAAGYRDGTSIYYASFDGFYWSSTLCSDIDMDAHYLFFLSNKVDRGIPTDRYTGHSVRPVMEKETVQPSSSSSNISNSSEKVYSSTEVDVAPKFNGGDMGEFTKWINQNVVYPDIAKQYDIKGRVITKFTIHSNGQISDIQILKGVDPSLDKEAINVLKKAPALTPAKKGGENVAVSYMLPIDFGR